MLSTGTARAALAATRRPVGNVDGGVALAALGTAVALNGRAAKCVGLVRCCPVADTDGGKDTVATVAGPSVGPLADATGRPGTTRSRASKSDRNMG